MENKTFTHIGLGFYWPSFSTKSCDHFIIGKDGFGYTRVYFLDFYTKGKRKII